MVYGDGTFARVGRVKSDEAMIQCGEWFYNSIQAIKE